MGADYAAALGRLRGDLRRVAWPANHVYSEAKEKEKRDKERAGLLNSSDQQRKKSRAGEAVGEITEVLKEATMMQANQRQELAKLHTETMEKMATMQTKNSAQLWQKKHD